MSITLEMLEKGWDDDDDDVNSHDGVGVDYVHEINRYFNMGWQPV